jgi:hypothetical protein
MFKAGEKPLTYVAPIPPPFVVGRFEVELREGVFSGPWVASRREERPRFGTRHRVLSFSRRADAEAVCVAWALELLDEAEVKP